MSRVLITVGATFKSAFIISIIFIENIQLHDDCIASIHSTFHFDFRCEVSDNCHDAEINLNVGDVVDLGRLFIHRQRVVRCTTQISQEYNNTFKLREFLELFSV